MDFKNFLSENSLKKKVVKIEGIEEEFTIRQLSMFENFTIMKNNNIGALFDEKGKEIKNKTFDLDFIKNNINFKKDVVLTALISPKITAEDLEGLNNKGWESIDKLATEIIEFSNEVPK